MKNTGFNYRLKFRTLALFLCQTILLSNSVLACGWWGDGEVNREDDRVLHGYDGEPLPQSATQDTSKLPGRMGYGIAVPEPGRAVPYLQTTRGRQINRIAELKTYGYETVIDLGTPRKTAHLHQKETEAIGMRYVSIPVAGNVPSQEQVDYFTRKVIDASSGMLLVYSPTAELLGTMWAAYRLNLGAPVHFAINQGRKLGMGPDQETILRSRIE